MKAKVCFVCGKCKKKIAPKHESDFEIYPGRCPECGGKTQIRFDQAYLREGK